ncbi:MAG TPA: sulfite exporter TauE/SafE family protein [Thermoanaerobaculia bacterium]|nr:sulfite exporter TauE/SafE family protein [Thermoanaerobaculia bacterium]
MTQETFLLALTAASVGFVHTLLGPDHYLPFIVLARARRWSLGRTAAITLLCGTGHVLSSVVLGFVGIAAGIAVGRLEAVESSRGSLAAWLLIGVGVAYFAWGLHRALRRHGQHRHRFPTRETLHDLSHDTDPAAAEAAGRVRLTPWALFIVFVLGPCEPLIPVLMYPAATAGVGAALLVAAVFGVATLVAMTAVVLAGTAGLARLPLGPLERFSHAAAGAAIAASGLAVQFLGL